MTRICNWILPHTYQKLDMSTKIHDLTEYVSQVVEINNHLFQVRHIPSHDLRNILPPVSRLYVPKGTLADFKPNIDMQILICIIDDMNTIERIANFMYALFPPCLEDNSPLIVDYLMDYLITRRDLPDDFLPKDIFPTNRIPNVDRLPASVYNECLINVKLNKDTFMDWYYLNRSLNAL